MAKILIRTIVASLNDYWGVLHDTEEVDVGVVDGEVDEHRASGSIQPEIVKQRPE